MKNFRDSWHGDKFIGWHSPRGIIIIIKIVIIIYVRFFATPWSDAEGNIYVSCKFIHLALFPPAEVGPEGVLLKDVSRYNFVLIQSGTSIIAGNHCGQELHCHKFLLLEVGPGKEDHPYIFQISALH